MRTELQKMADAAWSESRSLVATMDVALYRARDALAFGQATRLYAIAEEDGQAWKFGVARNPSERWATLSVGNPRRLVLVAHMPATQLLERAVHYFLRRHKIGGEWFLRSRRTLVVAELILAAQEQCEMMDEDDGRDSSPFDALCCLTSRVEDLMLERAA